MTNSNLKKIGTHDGIFHCDESLACFMIQKLPQFEQSEIIRTRKLDCLDLCDIVVDVGGVYDPQTKRFDHHQKSFNLTLGDLFPNKTKIGTIKLSSAGLIYAHYGHEIIARLLGCNKDEPHIDKIFDKIYENFIKEVDAIDNGIQMFDEEPRYRITTHLSQRVSNLKPKWNDKQDDAILYERFLKAVDLTGKEFVECVDYYGRTWLAARELVFEAFHKRFEYDPNGRIIVFNDVLPWIAHLLEIEEENNVQGQIAFAIFPEKHNWYVRAVPISEHSFDLRNPLCSSWRGLKDNDLCEVSNISDCIFVHANGFIGGNKSLEGAIQMAKKSL